MDACTRAAEGFPRSDVDVFMIRTVRHKVICLQNDHRAKMKEIDTKLVELHALQPPIASGSDARSPSSAQSSAGAGQLPSQDKPFALVDEVSMGSPAHEAGLLVGDRILAFGPVRAEPSAPLPTLPDVASVVRSHEGKQVSVVVTREGQGQGEGEGKAGVASQGSTVTLNLVPKKWSGPGLLGCHIVSIQDQ